MHHSTCTSEGVMSSRGHRTCNIVTHKLRPRGKLAEGRRGCATRDLGDSENIPIFSKQSMYRVLEDI